MKTLVGFYIRRTFKATFPDGKTICAWPQMLYPSRAAAEQSLQDAERAGWLDSHYEHDVAEVYMKA